MLKITCPKNPKHKRFLTVAHVMQDWVVDEHGQYIRTNVDCLQVDHYPEKGNNFICVCKDGGKTCYTEAIVEEL